MSEIGEIIDIQITQDTLGVATPGFGVPMLLSHRCTFADPIRYYGGIADAAVDWGPHTPEFRFLEAVFSQSPHPELAAIGRASSLITQQYQMGAIAARNNNTTAYVLDVAGDSFVDVTLAYNSGSGATLGSINAGLIANLNGVASRNYVAAASPLVYAKVFTAANATEIFTTVAHGLKTGDGPLQVTTSSALPAGLSLATNYWVIALTADTFQLATSQANAFAGTFLLITTDGTGTQTLTATGAATSPATGFTVTGTASGNWFSIAIRDISAMSIKQTHADPGIAADLDAILLQDNNWYALCTAYNSDAYVLAAAVWTEAQTKIYIFDIVNTDSVTTTVSVGTDALASAKNSQYRRSSGSYYGSPALMLPGAHCGRVLPIEPGGETWAFKALSGPTPSKLSATHRLNLTARNSNWFQTVGGRNITQYGRTFDGNFLDIIRGLDWQVDDMQRALYSILVGNDKIGLDDPGISTIENGIVASLDRGVQRRIFKSNPRPVVQVPKAANISDANAALRTVSGIKFSAELVGAVHKLVVRGVVSV